MDMNGVKHQIGTKRPGVKVSIFNLKIWLFFSIQVNLLSLHSVFVYFTHINVMKYVLNHDFVCHVILYVSVSLTFPFLLISIISFSFMYLSFISFVSFLSNIFSLSTGCPKIKLSLGK